MGDRQGELIITVGNSGPWVDANCRLTMRCTRHLTQPALRCRSSWSASSASELKRYVP